MSSFSTFDLACMRRAIELARRGEGFVEPNPMVGCVIAKDERVLAEGWHARFGGPHAEVAAISKAAITNAAGADLRGATAYVTLEPCCHTGKTPPCTNALLAAGIARVVTAQRDPFPQVAGGGLQQLQAAGVQVEVGCCAAEARSLNAPYLKLLSRQQPWVIAKWAMSLDGKIATHTGHSRWISNTAARAITHRLRARVDAIVVGRRTAEVDDPQLTARLPEGEMPARIATRIVLDSLAQLSLTSHLVRTAREMPVLIFAGPTADAASVDALRGAGCEVMVSNEPTRAAQMQFWLDELGRRRMTNILVEGGGQLLGSLFDADLIDEAHIFIAPKLIGGADAPSPLAGVGRTHVSESPLFNESTSQLLGSDFYYHGRRV